MTPLFVSIVVIVTWVAAVWGWLLNIVTLAYDFNAMGQNELIIRIVGIPFAILGTILGYAW